MPNTSNFKLDVDLSDPEVWRSGAPHALFDDLRKHSPVHWHSVAAGSPSGGIWSLTRFDDIAQVSRDKDHFTSQYGATFPDHDSQTFSNMIFKDSPEHTRLRRIVSRGFSPRVVAQFEGWVRDIVNHVLDRVSAMDRFDFVAEIASVVPALVIADVLGVPPDRQAEIVKSANGLIAAGIDTADPGAIARAGAAMSDYGLELLELKRRHPAQDMISELVSSPDQLTNDEFRGFFLLLITAGFETTHTMMAQGMRVILESDLVAEQVALQSERENSAAVVEEILRYVSPVNNMARRCKRDILLRGQQIAEGDMVVMWYAAGSRDPEVFDNPHTFDPTRDPNPHMAFGGGGIHFCLGAHLARLEGRILFEELYRRGIRLKLDGQPRQIPNMFINQIATLPVARA